MIIKGDFKKTIKAFYKFSELQAICKGAVEIWRLIKAFIFTLDGYGIVTSDGFVIKCKNQ